MERLTLKLGKKGYQVNAGQVRPDALGYSGPAIDRLGRFEDALASLLDEQEQLTAELEELRAAGKNKSVQFREKMGRKLMNARTLTLFQVRGLL